MALAYEQSKSMTVSTYYGKLTALWEELNAHEPIVNCGCCSSCSAGQLHEDRRAQCKLHEFFMAHDSDYYSNVHTNIFSLDPLPTLNRAYRLVVQAKRVCLAKTMTGKSHNVASFALRTAPYGSTASASQTRPKVREDKSHLTCTHCKKSGHEVSSCFELVGYPT